MVMLPQIKINRMITQANKVKAFKALSRAFPATAIIGAVIDKGDVEQMVFTTSEINESHIVALADLHCEIQCKMIFKRSGTKITVRIY